MKEVAIYLRVNHPSQIELELQENLCETFADTLGLEPYKVYRDVASGNTLEERPALMELLEDVKKGYYEALIVANPSRLTRKVLHYYELLNFLEENDVKLYTLQDVIQGEGMYTL
ncbi:MAG: recombinase family protein [Clostridia bacterium]|nr:recombinase family protein [Clostridia bacterium]